jgi:hypothetical protein
MSEMKKHIEAMVASIDMVLGEGYARKNPDLLGRLMQAECSVAAATLIQDGLYFFGAVDDEDEMQLTM